jgi:hypothetical protein
MSYHQVLPRDVQWPHLLSKELNIPNLVNYATGCGSNSRIIRTTFDFLNSHDDLENTLVIIQISDAFRFEFISKVFNEWVQCNNNACVPSCEEGYELIANKLKHYNKQVEFLEYFQQVMALEYMLKMSKVKKYFIINWNGGHEFDHVALDKINFLNNSISWIKPLDSTGSSIFKTNYEPFKTDPHPNKNGHQQIADWVLDLIKYRI